MNTLRARIDKIEQRLEPNPAPGEIDWPALLAYVAKHGKRLVRFEQEN